MSTPTTTSPTNPPPSRNGPHHQHQHPRISRQPSRGLSLRNVIEHMPVMSRDLSFASMPKEELLTTMDSNRTLSKRCLDSTSREFAAESTRNLMAAASSRRNLNMVSRDLASIADEEEDSVSGDGSKDGGSSSGGGGGCCNGAVWKSFDQDPTSKGYAILGICRGTILMSNVFLSSSLIYLASVHAGCVDEETGEILDDCDGTAYGFQPASLITNIAVISGLLAAFFLPVLGAIIDYTEHRRNIGILSAIVMTVIQGIQIGTVQQTWFPMAMLQAVVGFVFFIQILATFAYLPEMARNVGGDTMNYFTKWFTFIQFSTQLCFLIVVIVIGFIVGLDTVQTGQTGQGVSTVASIIGFTYAWGWLLPSRPASKVLPEGHALLLEGFRQNIRTVKFIQQHYKKGLRWFLVTTAVAEAGVSALLPVGITFLTEEVKLDGTQIGIVFAVALITSLFGSLIGAVVTTKTNPRVSWMWCLAYFVVVTIGGAFALVEERAYLGNVWGALWGIGLGWFYPVENLMFSLSLPKGSENEMTGLFIYTSQILAWLPPFVFSVIVEAGQDTRWGFMSLILFQGLGIGFLMCMASWKEVLEETNKLIKPESNTTTTTTTTIHEGDEKEIRKSTRSEEVEDDIEKSDGAAAAASSNKEPKEQPKQEEGTGNNIGDDANK